MTRAYLKFKLINSLHILLIHNTIPDAELDVKKPLKELIYSDVSKLWVYISLMQWEIHNGFKIDPKKVIDLSIQEIVNLAIENGPLQLDEFQAHVTLRMSEINNAIEIFEKETDNLLKDIDKNMYLENLN